MKKDDRIGHFEHFKRLRYRPTNGQDLLYVQKCEDALKNENNSILGMDIGQSDWRDNEDCDL